MNFASVLAKTQEAPWYRSFLTPVLDQLGGLPPGSAVLDLGTGPGKLLELINDNLDLLSTGADIDQAMLDRARARRALARTPLIRTEPGTPLPFHTSQFAAVCLCSVLFLLPDPEPLLDEALRITHADGEVLVLTPTGAGTPAKALSALPPRLGNRIRNSTLFVWHRATGGAGRRWAAEKPLQGYSQAHDLTYTNRQVFHGMATLETLRHQPSTPPRHRHGRTAAKATTRSDLSTR